METARSDDIARHFEAVAQMVATIDIDETCSIASEIERRVPMDEFLEEITVVPDCLSVNVHGAPPVQVLYQEVGLKESGFGGVGGGTLTMSTPGWETSWAA